MEGIKFSEDCLLNKIDLVLVVEIEEMVFDVRLEGSEVEIVFVDDEKVIDLFIVDVWVNKMGMEVSIMGLWCFVYDFDVIEVIVDIFCF